MTHQEGKKSHKKRWKIKKGEDFFAWDCRHQTLAARKSHNDCPNMRLRSHAGFEVPDWDTDDW
jgi:hypothetical protein